MQDNKEIAAPGEQPGLAMPGKSSENRLGALFQPENRAREGNAIPILFAANPQPNLLKLHLDKW
jgi:hypothetical protein